MVFGILSYFDYYLLYYFPILFDLRPDMQIRNRGYKVDGVNVTFQSMVNVHLYNPAVAADFGIKSFVCDSLDRFSLTFGSDRGTCLDYRDSHIIKGSSNEELLLSCQGDSRCLFTISQSGIQKANIFE